MNINLNIIENLVFEGGGVKGCAFAGAIQCLEDKNLLHNIKRFAGSSAGAWAATLLAIGLKSAEFSKLLNETDLGRFKDSNSGCGPFSVMRNSARMVFRYSWHKGDMLEKTLGEILEKHTGNRDITFDQLFLKYGKELVITATNVNQAKTIYFHRHSYPDFLVRTAVRASMAIPFYFKPVIMDNEYLVDGGVLNNYPIWIFDNCDIFPCDSAECNMNKHEPNQKTLGFKLVGQDEHADNLIFHGKLDTSGIRHYMLSLIDCMGWQIERSGVRHGYWERTVIIPTFEIKTTDFDIGDKDKQRLFESGYQSLTKYFANIEHNEFHNINLNDDISV